ncbi:MAG: response regulator [Crocinitomicaceae bacterium]
MKPIKIAITDDDILIVDLLSRFLDQHEPFELVKKCYSISDFYDWETSDNYEEPDLLLLDLKLKDGNGKDIVEYLQKKETGIKVIVLSSHYSPNYLGYMFRLGAHAFLPKAIHQKELIPIINQVYETGHYFMPDQIDTLRSQIAGNVAEIPVCDDLRVTKREMDVLVLLCHQYTAKKIAEKLFISPKTVEGHKTNLLLKTGAKNIAGLIIFASQNKLIDLNEIML